MAKEKKALTPKQREKIIVKQVQDIKKVIEDNQILSVDALRDKILAVKSEDGRKIKPDAIRLALDVIEKSSHGRNHDTVIQALTKALDIRNISTNKSAKKYKEVDKKRDGLTSGAVVEKIGKSKKIMQKNAIKDEGFKGGEVCEYISNNIANMFMPIDTPKFRLHVADDKKVKVASTFIPNFETIYDRYKKTREQDNDVEGGAKLFATAFLTGHYDVHKKNVGIRADEQGKKHYSLIDFGRGLSYNVDANWRRGRNIIMKVPQTAEKFRQRMIETKSVIKEHLEGEKFACELKKFIVNIDTDRVEHIVKLSIENLKLAYGDDFLGKQEVRFEMFLRMGIILNRPLTEKVLVDAITKNITRGKKELTVIANKELEKSMSEALSRKDYYTAGKLKDHLNLGQSATDVEKDYQAVINSLLKQRSSISKIQITLGLKKVDSHGLTDNENRTYKNLRVLLRSKLIEESDLNPAVLNKALKQTRKKGVSL